LRAIFLDRDGVICQNRPDHVKSWNEFEFLPRAKESLAALSRLGLPVVVVTNQAAIGRKLVSAETVEEIHRNMVAEIHAFGGRIDKVIYCPHRPQDGCPCRKPEPGMLQQVAAELGVNLVQSYLVGDAATDLIAGQRVGCQTFLVLTGRGHQQLDLAYQTAPKSFVLTRNLLEATHYILRAEMQITDNQPQANRYKNYYHQLLPI